jgi:branched-chain amino acid aminotransferase
MKKIYLFDGRKITEKNIDIGKIQRGFLYGDGIFETLRAENYKIFRWENHWERMKKGAETISLHIKKTGKKLKEDTEKALKTAGIKNAYVRVNLYRAEPRSFDPAEEKKSHVLVMAKKYRSYPETFYKKGVKCIVSRNHFKNEFSPITYIKSLNYLENILSRLEAGQNGCDETILLNTSGYIAESSVSNIFMVKKRMIYTPSVDCGILQGITRKIIFEICEKQGIKYRQGKFTVEDLKTAEEIFLTNTIMGIMPVREIKGLFRTGKFEISRFISEQYEELISEEGEAGN